MAKGWYGVGLIKGRDIGQVVNAERQRYIRGNFLIDGSTLVAGSGSDRYWGCPYGTYILTPQATGPTIRRLYRRLGVIGPAFDTVWNVGRPGKITSTGFDPGAGRQRRAIQIHCDYRLTSMGCIVMNQDDFQAFASMTAEKSDMVLEVAPADAEGGVEFRVLNKEAIGV